MPPDPSCFSGQQDLVRQRASSEGVGDPESCCTGEGTGTCRYDPDLDANGDGAGTVKVCHRAWVPGPVSSDTA